jgi:predicted nucleotidyltransferase
MSTAPDLTEVAKVLSSMLPSAEYRILLFGSRATGEARPLSDWDLGILGPHPLDGALRQRLRDVLEAWPTLHTFDLVDLAQVPESFRNQAVNGARRLA